MSDTDTVYVLRCCRADGTSHEGFQWPRSGPVEAPDWSPEPECGSGLHGWLWGEGSAGCTDYWEAGDALWLVVEVAAADVVDLGGKVKFRRGDVVRSGSRDEVVSWLAERCPGRTILFGAATAGERGTATAGERGTATAGDGGTATAGDHGRATAGDGGTATAGDSGTATAGDSGTICLRWWDSQRYRMAVGYVGEDGIEAGKPYRWDAVAGRFAEVSSSD